MTDQKLIDDVVTAFTDHDLTAPSRDDIARVLEVFETSLRRCGCDACTTARRERIGLTEHDLTSLARVLHEVVYSPGASFDRAVPGIQEYMHACAEKVAAALPWVVPTPEVELVVGEAHTPTDDERRVLGDVWDDGNALGLDGWVGPGRGTEPIDDHAVQARNRAIDKYAAALRRSEQPIDDDREAQANQYISGRGDSQTRRDFLAGWDAAIRRTEVPEPSKQGAHGGTIPLYGMLDVWMALYGTSHPDFDAFYAEHGYAETWARILAAVRQRRSEPQDEPSDAQVEAAARAMFEPDGPGGDYTWAEMVVEDPSRADIWREDARKVLRAASVVTEQGENR
ncbi:hypothetical protein [Microbacterium sp. MMO-113]|uniref:hypothetical protein n=1 Tax=Microbacterium sp. MMO-113 TaxID=3081273 RepID=UPI003018A5A1